MFHKLVLSIIVVLFSFNPVFLPQQSMAMPKSATPAKVPIVTGTILETMNASGYTYMLIDDGSKKTWVAIPATTVTKGTKVSYYQGMVMNNFTSKTLGRTFDAVVFSTGLAGQDTEAALNSAPATQAAPGDSFSAAIKAEQNATTLESPTGVSAGSAGAIVPLKEISIEKSTAPNGYTVGELFEKAKELSGKKVQVRGKVVKFNPMIMGKNWIHLQDGTGNPMENSHDLVVTSDETVKVGSVVTIEGTLATEKDFGAGYKYAVIIENASIIK
jgi:hypothetical protein